MSTLMNHRQRLPRLAEAADRARLRVVPRRASHATRVPFITLVSALLLGGVVGLLLFNTSMQQSSFTATRLEQRADALAAKKQGLQLELATLRDPQRIAARARRLGMVPAPSPAFLRLSDERVLGNPVEADPGQPMRISPLPERKPPSLVRKPRVVTIRPGHHHQHGHALRSANHRAHGSAGDPANQRSGGAAGTGPGPARGGAR